MRKGAASEAARGHDRRSPPVESLGDGRMRRGTGPEPQAGPRSAPARHGRADPTNQGRRSCSERPKRPSPCAAVERSQQVGFETVLSLTRLSTSKRPTTCQMVAERSGRPNSFREVAGEAQPW